MRWSNPFWGLLEYRRQLEGEDTQTIFLIPEAHEKRTDRFEAASPNLGKPATRICKMLIRADEIESFEQ